jgi:hypothetical protein
MPGANPVVVVAEPVERPEELRPRHVPALRSTFGRPDRDRLLRLLVLAEDQQDRGVLTHLIENLREPLIGLPHMRLSLVCAKRHRPGSAEDGSYA